VIRHRRIGPEVVSDTTPARPQGTGSAHPFFKPLVRVAPRRVPEPTTSAPPRAQRPVQPTGAQHPWFLAHWGR
jgi:hypothetical protein